MQPTENYSRGQLMPGRGVCPIFSKRRSSLLLHDGRLGQTAGLSYDRYVTASRYGRRAFVRAERVSFRLATRTLVLII